MSPDDRDLESLLRRALADEAGRVEPAGDGLRRIQKRTARPGRDWSRWRMPVQALAGAAALVLAIVAAGPLLRAPAELSAPPAASGSVPVSATPAPTPAEGTPIAGAGVNDLATVWPYPSRRDGYARAEQDIDAGTYPDLTRADVAAVAFVESYVGADQQLTAESAGRWKAGLRMEVRRGTAPVSLVYLVRVRVGNDAPYVVVEAAAATLTLDRPPAAAGAEPLRLGGTVRRYPGDAAPDLTVQLREPGVDDPVAVGPAAVTGRGQDRRWLAQLVPTRTPSTRTLAVAAWITDPTGAVAQFTASPTTP